MFRHKQVLSHIYSTGTFRFTERCSKLQTLSSKLGRFHSRKHHKLTSGFSWSHLEINNRIQSGLLRDGSVYKTLSSVGLHNNTKCPAGRIFKEAGFKRCYSTVAVADDDPVVNDLYDGLLRGDRASLARSITLIETTNAQKKLRAQLLLDKVLKLNKKRDAQLARRSASFRIGMSGPPGAGKSTFIEAFGKFLTSQGKKVAVLAVDPSSSTTGGSLLGDKTRMPELSCDMNAYIRPSPSCGTLGGVTRTTNDAIVLCEGCGFEIILVETVGVGQSEFAVADMVDLFCLLIPPAGGDELQGIKKGIVEVSDLVIVNKADGDLLPAAKRIQAEYISATKFIRPKNKVWKPKVVRVSSKTLDGMDKLWEKIQEFQTKMVESGLMAQQREIQHKVWMWNHIRDNIMELFANHPSVKPHVQELEAKVAKGTITSGHGADLLLHYFTNSISQK